MRHCTRAEVVAIASRDRDRAKRAASQLSLPLAFGSYEEMLADPTVEAIYNPLPNHLHVPWTIKAAEAGKHVLCEKPIAMSADEARQLISVRDRTGAKIGEAFMVRTHPEWLRIRELVQSGEIGDLRAIMSAFSYFNKDKANIRNIQEYGGGALMDVGCYPITISRFLFGREPARVFGLIDKDPDFSTDRLTSGVMDFGQGQSVFTCSTQLVPFQRMEILGTKGRIAVEIPYNIPPDRPSRILIDDGSQLAGANARVEEFPATDQYATQGDAFSQAIQEDTEVPVTVEDAVANMEAIEALFRSADSGTWQ